MAVGKKIAVGFGVVLTLLAVAGFLSYAGMSSIVNNAGQVIDGNVMNGILAQKVLSRKQIRFFQGIENIERRMSNEQWHENFGSG